MGDPTAAVTSTRREVSTLPIASQRAQEDGRRERDPGQALRCERSHLHAPLKPVNIGVASRVQSRGRGAVGRSHRREGAGTIGAVLTSGYATASSTWLFLALALAVSLVSPAPA